MKFISIFLTIFWIIIIVAPQILAYLIGWFFIFVWINLFLISAMKKKSNESFVKFGNYKIFR
jgi:hypothetical protein